jgi:hypothetical protein
MTRPLLVIPVYRGGERFLRCLAGLPPNLHYFDGVTLSINSGSGSSDEQAARAFASLHPGVQVVVTGRELTSFDHTRFWAAQLELRGITGRQPLLWLAHDDELHTPGLAHLAPTGGAWDLDPHTTYLGPWIVRHESVSQLWQPPADYQDEVWTCFRGASPQKGIDWIRQQLQRPTYISFSGCVFPFASMQSLVACRPRKKAGMRVEMSMVAAPGMRDAAEFAVPVSIVYGRADSDRATIPRRSAQLDDLHLLYWLGRHSAASAGTRRAYGSILSTAVGHRVSALRGRPGPGEEWLVRQ